MGEDLNNPLVSVIMPAYNAEKYISESIDSVIKQTFQNWDLIIVDDGSIDQTSKIVNEFVKFDKRIKYYFQENGGQGKARNFGIINSGGRYIAFLDSDDLWLEDKLSNQIDEIIKYDCDLVFSDSIVFENESNSFRQMNTVEGYLNGKNAVNLFLKINRIPILTVLVKKEKILISGGFSELKQIQCVEDYHLWIKLLIDQNLFWGSGIVTAKYRLHNNSATSNDRLVTHKIPDMLYDLSNIYPKYGCLLKKSIFKIVINQYLNEYISFNEIGLFSKKYFTLFDRVIFLFPLKIFNNVFGARFTNRLIKRYFND